MATGRTGCTSAPNARMSCVFSVAASSGRDRNASHPNALATIATDTPVDPAVPSATTPPRRSVPSAIASRMIFSATRSLTDPPGLANSHLISTSHPVASLSDATRIMGVLPTTSSTENATGGGAFRFFFYGPDPRRARFREEPRKRERDVARLARAGVPRDQRAARERADQRRGCVREEEKNGGGFGVRRGDETARRFPERAPWCRSAAAAVRVTRASAGPSRRTRGGASERAYPLRSQRWTDPAYPSFLDPRTLGRAPRARPSDDASSGRHAAKKFRQVFEIFSQVSDQTSAKGFMSNPTAHHRVPRAAFRARPAAVPAARSRVRASRRLSRPRADPRAVESPTVGVEIFPGFPPPCEHGVRPQRGVGALPGHGRGPQRRGERV